MQMIDVYAAALALADAALAPIVLWGGYNAGAHEGIGARYHAARHVLPRVTLAALVANLSLFIVQVVIELNNTLCDLPSAASASPIAGCAAVSSRLCLGHAVSQRLHP